LEQQLLSKTFPCHRRAAYSMQFRARPTPDDLGSPARSARRGHA
jgi:hypothetical protein